MTSREKALRELVEELLEYFKFCYGESRAQWPMGAYDLAEMAEKLILDAPAEEVACAACGKPIGTNGHPNVTLQLHFQPSFKRAMEKAALDLTEPYPMCDECYHKGTWLAARPAAKDGEK